MAPTEPVNATPNPWRRRLILVGRLVIVLAIIYFVVATTVKQWTNVRGMFHQLSWTAMVASLLAAVAAIASSPLAWREALDDLDHTVPFAPAGQVFLVGQLGKYLPGSVWSYVLQMELGRRAGIPRPRAFLASLITIGLGVTAGLAVGTLGLPAIWQAAHGSENAGWARVVFFSAVILLPVGLACAYPAALTRLVRLALRVLRREPMSKPLSWRGVLGTSGWAVVGYVFFALHLWLLARTQTPIGWTGFVACLGAIGLAIGVSTVVVVAPSGLGVREFVIAITLVGFGVPYGTGFAIALVSRLIVTVADVVAAGAAAAVAVRRLREPADASPGTTEAGAAEAGAPEAAR